MLIGPDAIEGYDIKEQIGRGGFATVYRAADLAHGRSVAIKVINGALNADERRRFDRERLAIGQVADHPNVVGVYESGVTEEGQAYMVLEFATGGSLGDRLEQHGSVPWPEAVEIMGEVADAVSAAHAVDIRHRDIKPDNILLSQYGVPKLSDFGIASVASGVTTTSAATMTISHSPPEMLQGTEITDTADVYALASTFHQLVSGQPPFFRAGDANVGALITRVLTEPAPSLVDHGLPTAVAEVISRALVKDPAARTPTAADFRTQLLAAAAQAPTPPVDPEGTPSPGSTVAVDRAALGLDYTPNPAAPTSPDGSGTDPSVNQTANVGSVLPLDAQPRANSTPDPGSVHTPSVHTPSIPNPSIPTPAVAGSRWPLITVIGLVAVLGFGALWAVVLRDNGGSQATDPTETTIAGSAGTTSTNGDGSEPAPGGDGTGEQDDNPVVGSTEPDFLTVGDGPSRPIAFDDEVWISNTGSGTISIFDPTSRSELAVVSVGGGPSTPVAANGAAWVALADDNLLVEIDLDTYEVLGSVTVGDQPGEPALVGTELWVPNQASNTLTRVETSTREVVGTIVVQERPLTPVAGRNSFWVTSNWSTLVTRLGPDGDEEGFFLTGELPLRPVVIANNVFVANAGSGNMTVYDIDAGTTSTIDFGADSAPVDPVFDGTSLWVPLSGAGAVAKVDPTTATLVKTINVDAGPGVPVFDGATFWLPDTDARSLQLIDAETEEVLRTVPLVFVPGVPVLVGTSLWVPGPFTDQVVVVDYVPQAGMADSALDGDDGDDSAPDGDASPEPGDRGATGPFDREATVQVFVDTGAERPVAECIVDTLVERIGELPLAPGVDMTPEEENIANLVVVECAFAAVEG